MEATTGTITSLRNYRTQNMKDYYIMVEYKLLKEDAPRGVYLMPSFEDLRQFYGVIFVETGLYRNAIFKFRLQLPSAYPSDGARPKLTFFTKVFHPLVHPKTLELDLSSKFPQWRTGPHHIATVLKFVKQIFYLKDYAIENAANIEAARLYARNRETFIKRVERCVASSVERRFINDPGSTIKFTEHSQPMDSVREQVLSRGRLEALAGLGKAPRSPRFAGAAPESADGERADSGSVP